MNKLDKAFELFDNFNKQDPTVVTWNGESFPSEYFYALKLHEWVLKLHSQPSEALLLASKCQHIGRWKSARESYPAGKAGYYKWRTDLATFHADTAGELLAQAGYGPDEIAQVQQIVLKKDIKTNPDAQAIEDALCLVFLQYQYDDFLTRHDDIKMVRIIQKSWGKMSDKGREAALTLAFKGRGKELILKALEGK